MKKTAIAAGLVTLLGSCVVDNTVDRLSKTELFLQEPNSLVDILFVVDRFTLDGGRATTHRGWV